MKEQDKNLQQQLNEEEIDRQSTAIYLKKKSE